MFCPNCKSEYRPGFTQCSDCGATLVAEVNRDSADQDVALAWRGTDPTGFSAAQAALDGAGIRSFPLADHDQLVWGLAIARPRYGLLVSKSDLAPALELVESIQERSPLANAKAIWKSESLDLESENESAAELPAADDAQDSPDDIPEKIKAADAIAVVWTGDVSMVEILDACLRENGIASVTVGEGNSARMLVLPKCEARAKEIIREIIEATPPE